MELMTSGWTDDRMDDLKHQVDNLGRRMIGLHATLTRFSLGFLGAALVAVFAAILTRGS
jgi:hypothetical protein